MPKVYSRPIRLLFAVFVLVGYFKPAVALKPASDIPLHRAAIQCKYESSNAIVEHQFTQQTDYPRPAMQAAGNNFSVTAHWTALTGLSFSPEAGPELPALKLTVYQPVRDKFVVLHVMEFTHAQYDRVPQGGSLTGVQRVYSPDKERDLRYECVKLTEASIVPVQLPKPVVQPNEAALPPDDAPAVNLLFLGDIMLADQPGREIRQGRNPFRHVVSTLAKADFTIGNLECVVADVGSPEPDKPYAFRAPLKAANLLARHVPIVALANNHSGDYGAKAFARMLKVLERQGVQYFGGGRTASQAYQPLMLERHGLKIALLSFNEFFPRSFEATAESPGIAWSDDELVVQAITKARAAGADLVIPFMHWGWEYENTASRRQQQLAYRMIEAGADAVVGGHPHQVQNVAVYRGKPIIYSLGNFVFDGFPDAVNNRGWMLSLQVKKGGVVRADTTWIRTDSRGTPRPLVESAPCWSWGKSTWGECVSQR